MGGGYLLYGAPGTGAVAVEAALRIAGAAYEVVDAPDAAALEALAATNPMRQVPALTFPDGETMTESATCSPRFSAFSPSPTSR